MVRSGKTITEVARYFGYAKGTVSKWMIRYPKGGAWIIPTKSSKPNSHPSTLNRKIVNQILQTRRAHNRCAEVVHQELLNAGTKVSLSSVKRTLDRAGVTKKHSPWKRLHFTSRRPEALKPGDLVMVDTIHIQINPRHRIYVYTLIDVYSRFCFAWATDKINTVQSTKFLKMAQKTAPFTFRCIQSDNGSEFSKQFTERIKILHRHSRVRKPNDNAHLERFNRTLQSELLRSLKTDVSEHCHLVFSLDYVGEVF
jgi:transposase InsO family protein